MAASSGSGSPTTTTTSSGGSGGAAADLRAADRRQRRMLSNRESARRSRMRKQKHLDELAKGAAELQRDNGQILASLNVTTQHYLAVEAQNSILRTQMAELSNRLAALTEILSYMHTASASSLYVDDQLLRPWPPAAAAAADMFQYCT